MSDEQKNEIVIISEVRRLELAYLAVFGSPDSRSADQRLVWADIEDFCYAYKPVTEKLTTAALDENSPLLYDGRRTVWLRFRSAVLRAIAEPKSSPKVSR